MLSPIEALLSGVDSDGIPTHPGPMANPVNVAKLTKSDVKAESALSELKVTSIETIPNEPPVAAVILTTDEPHVRAVLNQCTIDAWVNAVQQLFGKDTLLVVLGRGESLECLSEEVMEERGWIKALPSSPALAAVDTAKRDRADLFEIPDGLGIPGDPRPDLFDIPGDASGANPPNPTLAPEQPASGRPSHGETPITKAEVEAIARENASTTGQAGEIVECTLSPGKPPITKSEVAIDYERAAEIARQKAVATDHERAVDATFEGDQS